MPRVNINILGISELKRMGMEEFNSDDHYIYYCVQEAFRRSGIAFIVKNKKKKSAWEKSYIWQNDLGWFLMQTIQHQSNPNLFPITNAK